MENSQENKSRSLADVFALMREDQCKSEIEKLSFNVERFSHDDPKDALPPAHPFITRDDVLKEVNRSTSQALEIVDFDPSAGVLPASEVIRAMAKAGKFNGVGALFTESSEIAKLWHQKTAYSPLALAPQYNGEDVLPMIKLRADGSAPQAHEADRDFDQYLQVPIDDPARAAWRYHPDTVELRRRGVHLTEKIVTHLSNTERYPEGSVVRIAAIAGGAAWPDMQAVAKLSLERPDITIQLDVFDWDKAAIHLGVENAISILESLDVGKAEHYYSKDEKITYVRSDEIQIRFIDANITDQSKLSVHANENDSHGYDIVEAVGLVEYFDKTVAPYIVSNMDLLVKERVGIGIVANMSEYHDHPQILGVIGWRALRPRTLTETADFVNEGIEMNRPLKTAKREYELLDNKSYFFTTWHKN